jgi:hypothetical protein
VNVGKEMRYVLAQLGIIFMREPSLLIGWTSKGDPGMSMCFMRALLHASQNGNEGMLIFYCCV